MRKTLLSLILITGFALPALAQVEQKGTVNINTSSSQELQLLPRVGPALAKRIVEFRDAHGPFKSVEELMRVKGIGERSFAQLKPYLVTTGPTTLKEKVKARTPRALRDSQKPTGSK